MTEYHALYRFYSATGQLLYTGITNNPGNRFKQHQQSKPWWHEVSGITVEKYNSRAEVLAAEKRAIQVEQPKYNIQRPSLVPKSTAAPALNAAPPGLTWICEACSRPVNDGKGYLHVSMHDVHERERAWREFEKKHTTELGLQIAGEAWSEMFDMVDIAKWQAHHGECDPDPDSGDYWFAIERVRTHADLLRRTGHLMEKTWLEATDCAELIDRMSRVQSPPDPEETAT